MKEWAGTNNYVARTTEQRETAWSPIEVLVDNCADEHVCNFNDFRWNALRESRDPNLETANGHRIKHYGEREVKMRLKDGRSIVTTFQVCDVKGPILSVGKFCARDATRAAHFDERGGTLRHELAGEVQVLDRRQVSNYGKLLPPTVVCLDFAITNIN